MNEVMMVAWARNGNRITVKVTMRTLAQFRSLLESGESYWCNECKRWTFYCRS